MTDEQLQLLIKTLLEGNNSNYGIDSIHSEIQEISEKIDKTNELLEKLIKLMG